jgi:hypothetical protein
MPRSIVCSPTHLDWRVPRSPAAVVAAGLLFGRTRARAHASTCRMHSGIPRAEARWFRPQSLSQGSVVVQVALTLMPSPRRRHRAESARVLELDPG